MNLSEQLNMIERNILDLKRGYELYFTGDERRPPEQLRNKVKMVIAKLSSTPISNTKDRFRLETIINRFNAFQRLWDRIMLQIEQGTYRPDVFRANIRKSQQAIKSEQADKKGSEGKPYFIEQPASDERRLKNLYHTFIETRRVTRESTELSYTTFKKSIDKQNATLTRQLGDQFELKVVIEEGKTKIKGASKKF